MFDQLILWGLECCGETAQIEEKAFSEFKNIFGSKIIFGCDIAAQQRAYVFILSHAIIKSNNQVCCVNRFIWSQKDISSQLALKIVQSMSSFDRTLNQVKSILTDPVKFQHFIKNNKKDVIYWVNSPHQHA